MEPSTLDRILTEQRELSVQLHALNARLEVRFDAVDRQLDALTQRATVSTARSQVHEEILQQLAASMGRMDQYAAWADTRMAQHEERLARLEARTP